MATVLSGVALGVLVSLSSIGAGAIGATLILLLYPRLPAQRLVGTDIAHAVPLTLVAGIGQDYTPEEMVGKSIIVVANLQPSKLMGVESQAMLLAANDGEHLKIVVPEGEVLVGAKVK